MGRAALPLDMRKVAGGYSVLPIIEEKLKVACKARGITKSSLVAEILGAWAATQPDPVEEVAGE